MKRVLLLIVISVFIATQVFASDAKTVEMNLVSADGVGKKIGTIMVQDTVSGLLLKVEVSDAGLVEGVHGFHIHAIGNCGSKSPDGKNSGPALAAGGHYDPAGSATHKGPNSDGHLGDLPYINADKDGNISETVIAPRLKLSDVQGRALMLHVGGDNYSDNPTLGGGGGRFSCGVVR